MAGWMRAIAQAERPDWTHAGEMARCRRMTRDQLDEAVDAFRRIGRDDAADLMVVNWTEANA